MKGTCAEGAIQKLFTGKMKRFTKCIDGDYESSWMEEFNDIKLNIKGMKTLYDSFQDYVAVETLAGESMYQAEGFGLQDARKGVTFQSFPPVLRLQLKHHEYNVQRGAVVKLDDRFEFPFDIDLDEFLDDTADRTRPWKYQLHTVLAHSGDLHNGRHFALIKPSPHTRWLKFDDERVTPVTDREVLEENYDGDPLNGTIPQTQGNQIKAMKGITSAHTLVYIREIAINEVLAPLVQEDVPPHLVQKLSEERAQMEAKKKEREERRFFLTVNVVTDGTFSQHEGFDLTVLDESNSPLSDLPTFRVFKQETYDVFKPRVAQHFSCPENQIRLWALSCRQNKTMRLDSHIDENEPSLAMEAIHDNMAKRQGDLWLYLDILPDPSTRILLDNPGTIMIFLKHFDTARQSLLGICKIYVPRTSKVRDLIPIVNHRMKWPSETSLRLYEEIKPGMIELMDLKCTFAKSEIQDGDIICFQIEISDDEVYDLESRGLYSNPKQFYDFLRNRGVEPHKRE